MSGCQDVFSCFYEGWRQCGCVDKRKKKGTKERGGGGVCHGEYGRWGWVRWWKEGRIVGGFEGEGEVLGACVEVAGKDNSFILLVLLSFSPIRKAG